MDYCNFVFAGLPKFRIPQLQSSVNCAARNATNLQKILAYFELYARHAELASDEDRIGFEIVLMKRASTVDAASDYISELYIHVSSQYR